VNRTLNEKIFLIFYFPIMISFYLVYKYPTWFVPEDQVVDSFYWFGKSTGFWYSTAYTSLVCFIAFKVVASSKNPYGKSNKKPISTYQRNKFISIFLAQLIAFYLIPYIVPYLFNGESFFRDTYKPVNKNAYVYLYNGFTSLSGFVYLFIIVPVSVWFFGKRYCSWFCACGNLSEVIGVTKWGSAWVTKGTPRSERSRKWEALQYLFMGLAVCFGLLLFLDSYKIIAAGELLTTWRAVQDLVIDLIFGALIGVGAYPFMGTRIWCRYGCPLAASMRFFGKFSKSKFKVEANGNCEGLNLCTTQCPMGIDVASFAHKDKKPIYGSFGIEKSPCVGCGGCIDICPVQGLSFKKVIGEKF